MASRIHFKYWKNIVILRLYEQFLRDDSSNRYGMAPEKNYSFQNMYIYSFDARDLRFRICDYFCKISKFCDFMNNLSNFVKSVFAHISVKFKYFVKKFILKKKIGHVFDSDMCGYFGNSFLPLLMRSP